MHAHALLTVEGSLFKKDTARRIDVVIDYFGESRNSATDGEPLDSRWDSLDWPPAIEGMSDERR